MLSTTIFATLLAIAAAAPHAPAAPHAATAPQDTGPITAAGNVCGAGLEPHCCSDESVTNKVTTASLLSDLDLRNLLDLQCPKLDLLPLADILSPDKRCQNNVVCCGDNTQVGVVNLGCVPVSNGGII